MTQPPTHRLALTTSLTLLFMACGDDATSPPVDADVADVADVTPDAADTTPDVAPDTAPDITDAGPDVLPDVPVDPDGHPFDALPVAGLAEPLSLCAVTDDPSLRRILRLAALNRPSTAPEVLSAASLGVVDLIEGPWSGQQHLDLQAGAASLSDYSVRADGAAVRLDATVRHPLGAAGFVDERYAIRRDGPDDLRPASLDAITEVTFWFAPPDAPDAAVQLFPCAAEGFAHQERVLVARAGDRYLSLVELADLRPAGAAFTRRVRISWGEAWRQDNLDAYWAIDAARASQGAGPLTRLRIDLTESAGHHQQFFGPQRPSWVETATAALEVDADALTVTTRAFPAETDTTETLAIERDWIRVDAAAAIAAHAGACEGQDPETALIGGYGVVVRIVYCPRDVAPGIALLALQPVIFDDAIAHVGATFTDIAPFTDDGGRPGFDLSLGEHRITLTRGDTSGWYLLHLFGPGGTSLSSMVADEVDLGAGFYVTGQDVDQISDDREVTVGITRLWAAQGVGHTAIYAPLSFRFTRGETVVRVEAWDHMDYRNTHHNWDDHLEVRTDTHIYRWQVTEWGGGATLEVEALEGGGTETFTLVNRQGR